MPDTITDLLDRILDDLSTAERTEPLARAAAMVVEIAHRLGVDLPGGEDPWAEDE